LLKARMMRLSLTLLVVTWAIALYRLSRVWREESTQPIGIELRSADRFAA
jgi:hypothetical protein